MKYDFKNMWNGWDNNPNRKIKVIVKISFSHILDMVLYLKSLMPYIKKIEAKQKGVNIPNSFNRKPEAYDPYIPNIFLFSVLVKTSHPVSSKLNDIEDKNINDDITKKTVPNMAEYSFLLKVKLEIYSLSCIIIFFKIIWHSL